MYKIIFLLLLLSLQCQAALPCPWGPVVEGCKPLPLIPENYSLRDLGETKFTPELLDRFASPQTYAPRINNSGMIAFNLDQESIVRLDGEGEISPHVGRSAAMCFGLNNVGGLLLAVDFAANDHSWFLWKTDKLRKESSFSIHGVGLQGSNIYLRALNDQGIAVGALRPAGRLRPLFWSREKGLHHLGYFFGWDLEGIAWDVNDNGTVVGTVYPQECDPQVFIPFAWSEKMGLERLRDYRTQMGRQLHRSLKEAEIEFFNPVIDHEDIVYGQVVIDGDFYRYMWYPGSNELRLMDLSELRLSCVNKNRIFGGSLEGAAVLYQRYLEPIALSSLVSDLSDGWELLEITDINDHGALVGFAKVGETYHQFHAIPEKVKPKVPEPKKEPELEPTLNYIFHGMTLPEAPEETEKQNPSVPTKEILPKESPPKPIFAPASEPKKGSIGNLGEETQFRPTFSVDSQRSFQSDPKPIFPYVSPKQQDAGG